MSRILLIQSDPAAAERIRQLLGAAPGLELMTCVGSLAEATDFLARQVPDLVLSDLRLSDGPVTEVLDQLGSGRVLQTLAVVIAPAVQDPMLMDALRHGAEGYVVAGALTDTLVPTLRQVLAGESPMAPEIAREIKAHFESQVWDNTDFVGETQNPMHLSDNERQLLDWIGDGHPLADIARSMGTTPHLLGIQLRNLCLRMQFAVSADTLTLSIL
ncbi:MAG: response regulator transcription factor [Burkholderiaceae bacterium]